MILERRPPGGRVREQLARGLERAHEPDLPVTAPIDDEFDDDDVLDIPDFLK